MSITVAEHVYNRAGAAGAAGAPFGAAVNVAQTTRNASSARVAGEAFGLANRGGAGWGATDGFSGRVEKFIGDEVVSPTVNGMFKLFHWLGKPVEKVGDYHEAQIRYRDRQLSGQGSALGFVQSMLGMPAWWDSDWRDAWNATQTAGASVAQTAWQSETNLIRRLTGAEGGFDILDDPARDQERQEYFGSGYVRWTTGLVDAAFTLTMDPLIIGGAAVGAAKAARNAIKPADVAWAAESHRTSSVAAELASDAASVGTPVGNLTHGARRIRNTVDRVVEASERVRESGAGGYADLAAKRMFAQTADSGAIPYFMSQLDRFADDTTRITMKREALYAGMGDRAALKRLQDWDDRIALELESLVGPNPSTAIASMLSRLDMPHADKLRLLNEGDDLPRMVKAYREQLAEVHEALYRTRAVGNPANLTSNQLASRPATVGEIGKLGTFDGTRFSREYARVGRTIHHFPGLAPLHVLYGRHLPGMFSLSSDDAYQSFGSALMRARHRGVRKSYGVIDDQQAREFADRFALSWSEANPAASRAARRNVVDDFNKAATDALVLKYGAGNPLLEEKIRKFVGQIRSNRTDEMMVLHERAQRAAQLGEDFATHRIEEGVVVWKHAADKDELSTPFAGTQLADLVSIPDYMRVEKAVRLHVSSGFSGFMEKAADGVWRFTTEGLTQFSDLWKLSALLRLGYPIRTQVDSQARQIAVLGAMRYFENAVGGAKHLPHNLSRVTVGEVEDAMFKARLQTRIDDIDTFPNPPLWMKEERDRLQDALDNYKPRASDRRSKKVRRGKTVFAERIGMGDNLDDAYRGINEFDRVMGDTSAKDSILGLMVSAHNSALHKLRASGQWQHIVGSHPKWDDAYIQFTNHRVRNSHGLMMMLAGRGDDEVVEWLKLNPDGMAQLRGMAHRYTDEVAYPTGVDASLGGARAVSHELTPEQVVQVMRNQLDTLYPNQAMRSLVLADDIDPAMIRQAFDQEAMRPAIPAELLDTHAVNPIAETYNTFRTWWFKWAAQIPEERLARHPFYQARFSDHVQRLAPRDKTGEFATLTIAQVNQLRKRAGILARRDISRYMFDTAQKSNLAHLVRFMSPFYAAWSDTMRKWMRILGEHPGFAPVIPKSFMAPNNMVTVVDNDGNRIRRDGTVIDGAGNVVRKSVDFTEGYLLLGVPEWVTGRTGGSDTLRVSKGSLNVVFQGDPWFLPGPGPIVSVPVNHVATQVFPEMGDDPIVKWLLPFGTTDDPALDQTLPMWARNLKTALAQDFEDDRFAQTYTQIMADELIRIRRGEREPVSDVELQREVANKTRNWFLLRFLGSQAPFATSPTSRLSFWRDEWRRYRREFGADAKERFYEDYPDYFEASISLSINETGINATDEAWNAIEKYHDNIKHNPKHGWLWAGAANMAPGFDAHIYTAQKVHGFRGTKNPDEALRDARESMGWLQYRRLATLLQLKLDERERAGGSASLTAKSNGDLKIIRDQFLTALKADNPQWAAAFEQGGTGESLNEFFRTAKQAVADNPELEDRSDFQALAQYLAARGAIRAKLDERGLASVDSEGAEDLRLMWDSFKNHLAMADLGFQQMYQRAQLDQDIVGRG